MPIATSLTLGLLCSVQGIRKWQANALSQVLSSNDAAVGILEPRRYARERSATDQVLLWEKLAYRKRVDRMSVVSTPRPTSGATPQLFIDLGEEESTPPDAPLGTLSIRFCGEADPRAMFRAVAENRAITIEVVQRWRDEEKVLTSAVYPIVDSRTLSPTIESALARAELMLSRTVTSLASGSASPQLAAPDPADATATPSGAEAAGFIIRGVTQRFERLLRRKEYFLASVPRRGGVEEDIGSLKDRDDVRITFAPPGYFYADPFPFDHKGQEHLFFETYDYATKRGRIDWALVGPDGALGPVEPVLTRPYHLSYPFVFEHEGEVYMIPETASARRIELYQAVDFPRRWRLVGPLIEDISATDATLFQHDGRFWMLATVGGNGASSWDELHGFHAPSLFGPWTPHGQRPLKMDARSARPAGRLINEGGRLLRPAQDCSTGYGQGLVLNELEVLNETEFKERAIRRFSADWMPGNCVFHTLNASARFWWFDGKSLPPRS